MANFEFVSEAVITLSARDKDRSDIPERCIRLHRTHNTASVGRASKVQAKGFVAAEDNAWFNSPVMSRTHGQIVADLDKRVICIRDIGSLHGTYINGEFNRIAANSLREIYDGDELAFGVALLRNGESFDPMRVRVGIEFENGDGPGDAPRTRCSTFAVPEGSDLEEDYSSDDGKERETSGAMVKLLHDLMPTRTTTSSGSLHGGTIDLTDPNASDLGATRNGHGNRTVSNIIDLTSPRATSPTFDVGEHNPRFIMPLSEEERNMLDSDSQSNSSDMASVIIDERDDYDISDSGMSSVDDDLRGYSVEFDPYDTDLDDGLDDGLDDELEDGGPDHDFETEYSSDDDMIDPDDPDTVTWNHLVPDVTVAKEAERTPTEGNPADTILAQAAEEAQAEAAPATEDATPAAKQAPAGEIPAKEPATLLPADDLHPSSGVNREYITIDDDKSDAPSLVEPEPESHTTYPGAGTRATIPSILNPVLKLDGPAATSGPEIPGSGVFGVWEANSSAPYPLGGSCSEPTSVNDGADGLKSTPQAVAPLTSTEKARESPAYRQPVIMFPLLEAGDTFLNSPDSFCVSHLEAPQLAGVAPGEETSAYDLQQTKLAEQARQRDLIQDRTRRTHVGIADIVDNCPQQSDGMADTESNGKIRDPGVTCVDRDGNSKRKSDRISTLSRAEVDWQKQVTAKLVSHETHESPAQSLAATMSGTPRGTVPGSPAQPRKVTLRRQGASSITSTMQPELPGEVRPAKRMRLRHIAEKIGYAALGGATVGAAIMTTLIYTAPSFA